MCHLAARSCKAIGITFSKRLGSPKGEKSSTYHQNPDEIGFLFRVDPFSYHYLGVQFNIGGISPKLGAEALLKRYGVTPLCKTMFSKETSNRKLVP